MTLHYDSARCAGVHYDGDWREGCDDCLRRTSPGDPGRQAWIDAPLLVVFECEYRIGPRDVPERQSGGARRSFIAARPFARLVVRQR